MARGTIPSILDDEEIKKLEGYFVQDHHLDTIINYDCDGYKENGEP